MCRRQRECNSRRFRFIFPLMTEMFEFRFWFFAGRNAMAKLETRIRELETELGSVQARMILCILYVVHVFLVCIIMIEIQARTSEFSKGGHRADRRAKELAFQLEEDKKNHGRMTELATKLQAKIKMYKKQIEEAEEIAALNLAKFRKAQQELEETEERAKLAEAQIRF